MPHGRSPGACAPWPRRRTNSRSVDTPTSPTVLIYATHDELFEPTWQRFMARELLGVEPIELPTGHFPMVEDPDTLGDLLSRLAREHP